ncbi:hypothetical protein IC582_010829 [Cucumis melo]
MNCAMINEVRLETVVLSLPTLCPTCCWTIFSLSSTFSSCNSSTIFFVASSCLP